MAPSPPVAPSTLLGDLMVGKRGFADVSHGWQARFRALSPPFRAVTRQMLRNSCRDTSPQRGFVTGTLEEADKQRAHSAAMKCHDVVCQFAPFSRRIREMAECELQRNVNLQLEVYIAGSTSFKVVEARARAAL